MLNSITCFCVYEIVYFLQEKYLIENIFSHNVIYFNLSVYIHQCMLHYAESMCGKSVV